MITINGQKMGKSLGNFINLRQLFDGDHKLLEQSYSPMAIRFFILQAHYGSTLDFSNEGLQAAEKGFNRMLAAVGQLSNLKPAEQSTYDVAGLQTKLYEAINDDLNTAIVISHLFDAVRVINSVYAGTEKLTADDITKLKWLMHTFVFDILGLKAEDKSNNNDLDGLMQMILELRANAKANKDFATSDKIRDELIRLNFVIKDEKDKTTWSKS
jgi:cysteinyl-tRNA synthetase